MQILITPPATEKRKVWVKLKSYFIAESGIAIINLMPLKKITTNILNAIDIITFRFSVRNLD